MVEIKVPAAGLPTVADWQTDFDRWLTDLQPQLSPINAYELSLILTDDQEIQQLNTTYRQQAQPTDVLAFAALEADLPGADQRRQEPLYLGDIIISVETAARQAVEHGHALGWEATWLAVHGLLHLLGWDHPDDASLQAMLARQTQLLNLLDRIDSG
jgi:probable rRNA maturation factor